MSGALKAERFQRLVLEDLKSGPYGER